MNSKNTIDILKIKSNFCLFLLRLYSRNSDFIHKMSVKTPKLKAYLRHLFATSRGAFFFKIYFHQQIVSLLVTAMTFDLRPGRSAALNLWNQATGGKPTGVVARNIHTYIQQNSPPALFHFVWIFSFLSLFFFSGSIQHTR